MKFSVTSPDEILRGNRPAGAPDPLFHVALIEPEIPQNTGNIGRTCVGTRSDLHLVGELGFKITDKNLKRAGLDYWQHLSWAHHPKVEDWRGLVKDPGRMFCFSAKAERSYFDVEFRAGDWLVFGRETQGLPDDILHQNPDQNLLIPILGPVRGYNVATSVAVVLFEGLRQLRERGELPPDLNLDPGVLAAPL